MGCGTRPRHARRPGGYWSSVLDDAARGPPDSFVDAVFRQHADEVRQAYALCLSLSYEDEDARTPIVSAGFNTEAGIEAALRRRSGFRRRRTGAADADEARWDFAFWSHKDLARFGDPSRDPDGAEALNRWIRDRRLWYDEDPRDVSDERFDRLLELDEAIDDGLIHVLATVAERVQRDTVRWVVGRPVPVLIHASDHSAELAAASRRANPAGLTDEYVAWVEGQEPAPEELAAEVSAARIFASSEAEEVRWLKFAVCVAVIAFALVSAWRAFGHDGTNAKPIDEGVYLYLAATPFLAAVAMDQLRGTTGGGDSDERGWLARLSETPTRQSGRDRPHPRRRRRHRARPARRLRWWGQDSNLRRLSQRVYSPSPLTAREPHRRCADSSDRAASRAGPRPPLADVSPRRGGAGPPGATRASSACGSRSGGSARA